MIIDYAKLSPTQNTTVLVKSPVPRALHAAVAVRLLQEDCVGGEQAGFIEAPLDPRAAARLQMMGGEFCGNATMALGALLARDAGLPDGGAMDLLIEVSGCEAPAPCRIRRDGDGWIGTVRMPLPERVREIALDTAAGKLTAPLIEMPGIAHLILPANAGLTEGELRERLPRWQRLIGADALGALVWEEETASIDPLVYVPSAGTLVRERGCGSGSAALGCWLALRAGRSLKTAVRQPGGVIEVEAELHENTPAIRGTDTVTETAQPVGAILASPAGARRAPLQNSRDAFAQKAPSDLRITGRVTLVAEGTAVWSE